MRSLFKRLTSLAATSLLVSGLTPEQEAASKDICVFTNDYFGEHDLRPAMRPDGEPHETLEEIYALRDYRFKFCLPFEQTEDVYAMMIDPASPSNFVKFRGEPSREISLSSYGY